jgi:transcriptional regulator with XRE-family HTH domain
MPAAAEWQASARTILHFPCTLHTSEPSMPPHRTPESSADADTPVTGELVRRYRKLLGLQQSEFAERWGLTQGALSQIESGRLGISHERASLLSTTFSGTKGELAFKRFLGQFSVERRGSLPLVGHPSATFSTLTVWRWDEDLDLATDPIGLEQAGLITLRLQPGARALALEVPIDGAAETLVFSPVEFVDLRSGDLVLHQTAGERTGPSVIATVEHRGQTSSRRTRFRPILPKGKPREVRPSDLTGLLRCVYRARYVS